MAAVLQFRRKIAPATWANDELAEFYRIVDVMGRAGLSISVDVGVSDEGEPWVVFVREETGDVLVHIARIDGWVVAVSAASQEVVRAQTLKEVVRRIVDTHPLVLLPANRPGTHIHIHPCAVLAAFIAAAYLLAEGIQSEAHAREFALTVAAEAAPVASPTKSAPHPNALRSALTSITDYLRGVGDLVQPVTVNSVSASAAIAAVVAFVFAGDDNGIGAAQRADLAANQSDEALLLQATAQVAEQISRQADRSLDLAAQAQALDKLAEENTQTAGLLQRLTNLVVETETAVTKTVTTEARDVLVAQLSNAILDNHQPRTSSEAVERLHVDAAGTARLVVVEGHDGGAKPVSDEMISTALATVAALPAMKAEVSSVLSAAISQVVTAPRAPSQDAASDLSNTLFNAAVPHSSSGYLTIRLSDLTKTALEALRLGEAPVMASSDGASLVSSSSNPSSSSGSSPLVTPNLMAAFEGGLSDTTRLTVAARDSVIDSGTSSSLVSSSVAKPVESVTDGLLRVSAPGTIATPGATMSPATAGSAVDSSTGPSAHQIISSIVSFAFGTDMMLTASAASRSAIASDLASHGISGTGQRVLVYASDTINIAAFEFAPGIVMIDRHEIASLTGAASILPPAAAGRVVDLADGAAIRLVGVIDLSVIV